MTPPTLAKTETLTVGDLHFEVRESPRRKTVGLTIDRGGELIISSPPGCDRGRLKAFVRSRRFWIYQKLETKETLRRPTVKKEYVSGEGFPYLGRNHRLLLVKAQDVPLKLEAGRFKLLRSEAAVGREHFVRWYSAHAEPWLKRRVSLFAPRIGVGPTGIRVRDLGYRWGSCGKNGTLNFNWATILLPPRIVEYVVAHELVHLHEHHHTPAFWNRLQRAMPDFEARKQWLAERGAEVAGV